MPSLHHIDLRTSLICIKRHGKIADKQGNLPEAKNIISELRMCVLGYLLYFVGQPGWQYPQLPSFVGHQGPREE